VTREGARLDARALVEQELRSFLEAEGKHTGDLTPRAVLTEELGLSSAEVALLLARIGAHLGIAPPPTSFSDLRTVGDLYALFLPASLAGPRRSDADPLESSRRRAEARRRGRLA
jgi:acyl carrier protein